MTKFGALAGKMRVQYGGAQPTEPLDGDFYFDNFNNCIWVYNELDAQWHFCLISTTTSTSSSTTTTSTSTTTTSTSTSSSSSTSTSTSSSTTTTL